jgi:hypothetical protein
MKTRNISHITKVVLAFCVFLFSSFLVYSQPDYVFTNPELISGTDLEVNAKYRFSNIKPGIDGIITIKSLWNVTLDELDGGSGFDEAFQPYIYCPGRKKGYVEFQLDFVRTGTLTPVTLVEIPMTAIDIDGYEFPDDKIYETDAFKLSASSYINFSTVGSNLDIRTTGPPANKWVDAQNTTGVVYDGIDTVQRDVMITVVHANVSSVLFRVGADNKSSEAMQRLRSIYFKKFSYPNGILAASPLVNFGGNASNNIVSLQYLLSDPSKVATVLVEKASSDMKFAAVQEFAMITEKAQQHFQDQQMTGTSYYRLKIVQVSGAVEYSNILRFENKKNAAETFKVFPSVVNNHVTVMLQSVNNHTATLQLFDFNGRIVYTKQVLVQTGTNTFVVDGLSQFASGTYIATIRGGNQLLQQKIVKQ